MAGVNVVVASWEAVANDTQSTQFEHTPEEEGVEVDTLGGGVVVVLVHDFVAPLAEVAVPGKVFRGFHNVVLLSDR